MLVAAASVALSACGHNTPQPSEAPSHPAPQAACRGHVPGHLDPVWTLPCLLAPTAGNLVADCC
jgi:hypothetical protein